MWQHCRHLLVGLGLLGILVGSLTVGLYPRLYDFIMKKVGQFKLDGYHPVVGFR
jgi:hypothetical protein